MAQLTSAEMNNRPDSDFAYIEPGGTRDSSGKTTPRSMRHFFIGDAEHVRNALARAPQSPFGDKAMPAIKAAAVKFGITVGANGRAVTEHWDGDVERRFLGGNKRSAYLIDGFSLEVRTGPDGVPHIVGYGAVYNRMSRNLGGFIEQVGDDSFNGGSLEGFPGTVARYNHDMNLLLGTVAGRTLGLRTDNVGLFYDVDPPKSRADIVELVQRGDVRHSSFAFRVQPGGDEWGVSDTNYPLRTLHDVELVDVAPVVTPAYPDATAGLRSLALRMDASEDEVRDLAAKDELRRFFIRTDRDGGAPAPKPPRPLLLGAKALMDLRQRAADPSDGQE